MIAVFAGVFLYSLGRAPDRPFDPGKDARKTRLTFFLLSFLVPSQAALEMLGRSSVNVKLSDVGWRPMCRAPGFDADHVPVAGFLLRVRRRCNRALSYVQFSKSRNFD